MNFDAASLQELQSKTQAMASKMQSEQQRLAALRVVGEAGAGLVKVTLNGLNEATKVFIDPSLLKETTTVIEELVAAAINDANIKVKGATQAEMLKLIKDLGLEGIGKTDK